MKFERLGNIVNLISGCPFNSSLFNEEGDGMPLIRVRDVNSGYAGIYYSGKYEEVFVINNGDLLIGLDGDFKCKNWENGKALLNQRVCKIVPINDFVTREYILHFLPAALNVIHRNTNYTTVKHLSTKTINEIKIPLPLIVEQIRIANILTKAENLIAQRKESIRLLDEFLKSTFFEMFGSDLIREKKWKIIQFGEIITDLSDYHANGSYEILREHVVLKKEPDYALIVRTTDLENKNFIEGCNYIDEAAYNFLKKSKIFGGEIIINKIGSAGNVYLMPNLYKPVSLGMNAFLLRFKEQANNIFIYYLLTSNFGEKAIQKHVKGAVTKTITKDAIRNIKIPFPPTELQIKFAQIVEQTETLKAQYQKSLVELENLYSSLSKKAFRGELNFKDDGLMIAAEPEVGYNQNNP